MNQFDCGNQLEMLFLNVVLKYFHLFSIFVVCVVYLDLFGFKCAYVGVMFVVNLVVTTCY